MRDARELRVGRAGRAKASATFSIEPLPECAVGSFGGFTYVEDGDLGSVSRPVSVTATSGGKIAAKVGSLSFAKTGWDEVSGGGAYATLTATRKTGKGKSAKTYTDILSIEAHGDWQGSGSFVAGSVKSYLDGNQNLCGYEGVVNADTEFWACKNVFGSDDEAKAVAAAVVASGKKGTRSLVVVKASDEDFAYMLVCAECCVADSAKGSVTVTAKGDGTATIAGKIEDVGVSGTAILDTTRVYGTAMARFFTSKFVVEVSYSIQDGEVADVSGRVWKK